MKQFLLASAAAIALAVAAPLAMAQYTSPPASPAPYAAPAQTEPAPSLNQAEAPKPGTTAEPAMTPEAANTNPYPAQTAEAPAVETEAQVAQSETLDAQPEAINTPIDVAALEQHARDAGMDGLPMTAADVCAPREVSLTESGSSLNREKRRQLINAADRASACELQAVVIHSPDGRGEAARQALIANGVDESLIEVQDAESGGVQVDMQFAGLAASSEQYAALFNPQQLAMAEPDANGAMMNDGGLPSENTDPLAPTEQNQEESIEPTSADAPVAVEKHEI